MLQMMMGNDFERKTTEVVTFSLDPAFVRKRKPVATGVLDYFPDAILAIAECSYVGSEQHNPGKPVHWDRSKSTDEADALIRHSAKVAWRALALLQKEIEAERK